jgi:ABC-type sugar transport system ATPase subunit
MTAVSAVDLVVGDGELLAIVGPSGSGKSTLLRLIAGLETATSGTLWVGGRRVDDVPPRDRDVAMVFQNPALYPQLTVFDNLAFGLRARGAPRREVRQRVAAVAVQLGLRELLGRLPATLSGGQRQRVALGRAIARRPAAYLFDEPFSSLDAPLRASLRSELLDLHRSLGATMIHVTHDQAEALALGQRVAVMDRGRLVQVGSPREVYEHPSCRFVAEFIGDPPMNVIPCEVSAEGPLFSVRVAGKGPELGRTMGPPPAIPAPKPKSTPGRVDLGLRPEQIVVGSPPCPGPGGGPQPVSGEVTHLEARGRDTVAALRVHSVRLLARLTAAESLRVGDSVPVAFDLTRAVWFDPATGLAVATGGHAEPCD